MSGLMTGDGISVGDLLLRYWDAGVPIKQAWLDMAYSIDAPTLILAGSCVRDQFGPEEDDYFPRVSWINREVSP